MSFYKELLNDIDNLRKDVATFRKILLHVHSPESYDYKEEKSKSLFIEALKSSEYDMIGITDHMKCSFACELSESLTSYKFCILPGMEISLRPPAPWSTFKLHILAIFPEKFDFDQISKILPPNIQSEKNRTGEEEINDMDICDFINIVHDNYGICIAAHIDSDRGARNTFRELGENGIIQFDNSNSINDEEKILISEKFKDWIFSTDIDAIEVSKVSDKNHYCWKNEDKNIRSIPVILTSDPHSIKEFKSKDDRVTHVKMTKICFKDLRNALLFPDTRLKFPSELPNIPSQKILGLEIKAGGKNGFFKNLKIAFSDNLNCLIGPRGSGKSTIIEALRYIFGYNVTINVIEDKDLINKIKGLQKNNLNNCLIRVIYSGKKQDIHILEAAYDPNEDYATRVFTIDGEEIEVPNVEKSGDYPLRFFGWSEIETLGREAHRQRTLLDRLIEGITAKLEKRDKIRMGMAEIRRSIISSVLKLDNIMNRENEKIKRYKEFKSAFEKLNTDEVKELFDDLDNARIKDKLLEKIKMNTIKGSENLNKTLRFDFYEDTTEILSNSSELITLWFNDIKNELKLDDKQMEIKDRIRNGLTIFNILINDLDKLINSTKNEIQNKDKELRENVSEEAAKQIAAESRRRARERLENVEKLRQEYLLEWNNLKRLLKEWNNLFDDLKIFQKNISNMRENQKNKIVSDLNQFKNEDMEISIEFRADYDRNEFIKYLRDSGFLSTEIDGRYKANLLPERIAAVCNPIELAESIIKRNNLKLINKEIEDNKEYEIDEAIADKIINTLYPFGKDETADVKTINKEKIEKILRMAEVPWDDKEYILLNNNPVEHLSPGQRSSAMLPLIALTENAPLIIDQPEDNLDNKLIGKMLVDILADLKEKRQIIVATHNPNIVVSGDAEQVIELNAESDKEGKCVNCGSIDNEIIVKSVIDIMEGGELAFENRSKRYGYDQKP